MLKSLREAADTEVEEDNFTTLGRPSDIVFKLSGLLSLTYLAKSKYLIYISIDDVLIKKK